MKTKYIIPLFAGLFFAVSCMEIDEQPITGLGDNDVLTLKACHEEDPHTRTVRQSDGAVWWSPQESIRVFYTSTSSKFTSTNTSPTPSATFIGALGGYDYNSSDKLWALYPYSDDDTFDGNPTQAARRSGIRYRGERASNDEVCRDRS